LQQFKNCFFLKELLNSVKKINYVMKKIFIYGLYAGLLYLAACASKANNLQAPPPQTLPVVKLNSGSATTWQEYPATVQGTVNVEIRPQVGGYLEKN
jgi:membrane fusion protein (multidrug efflux system)